MPGKKDKGKNTFSGSGHLRIVKIRAIILTKNEEAALPGCLASLREVVDEIVIVDSGSTDRTVEIGREAGALVLLHEFENQARQMNWALDALDGKVDWYVKIDADERLSTELRVSLRSLVDKVEADVSGVLFPLRTEFLGRTLRHGATYPVWLLRAWRSGMCRAEDKWMDEHMVLLSGRVKKADGDLIHCIPKSLSEWSHKHIRYAERECVERARTVSCVGEIGHQARVKRFVKYRIYYRLPLFIRPVLYWGYRYLLCFGFLDGVEGFVYHFVQAAWYRLLVDAMLFEQRKRDRRVE